LRRVPGTSGVADCSSPNLFLLIRMGNVCKARNKPCWYTRRLEFLSSSMFVVFLVWVGIVFRFLRV
jgi:hypothetical protein